MGNRERCELTKIIFTPLFTIFEGQLESDQGAYIVCSFPTISQQICLSFILGIQRPRP